MRLLTTRLSSKLLSTLILTSLLCLIIAPMMLGRRNLSTRPAAGADTTTHAPSERAREAYGRMPLSFEANRGQAEESVDFIARGAGYALSLKPTEAVFALRIDEGVASSNPKSEIRNPNSAIEDAAHEARRRGRVGRGRGRGRA